jgi:hypothetical protein
MMNQAAFDRPTGMKRLLQCIEDKARRSGAAGPPAHDPSSIDIDNECDINEAAPGGDACEIGHPELVRPVSGELPIHLPVEAACSPRAGFPLGVDATFASLPVRRIGDGLITVHALTFHPDRRRHPARSNRCGGSTQFLAHRPVPVFANAWTSDRSHRRSSIASVVQSPRL